MEELRAVCQKYGLDLAILYGSQARGVARADSDYDVGVRKRQGALRPDEFLDLAVELSRVLGTGQLDLVDLQTASALLQYEAARNGRVLYEAEPGLFNRFHVLAWKKYQDEHYDLRRLDRVYVRRSLQRLIHDPI